jgi:hypothetical protein
MRYITPRDISGSVVPDPRRLVKALTEMRNVNHDLAGDGATLGRRQPEFLERWLRRPPASGRILSDRGHESLLQLRELIQHNESS